MAVSNKEECFDVVSALLEAGSDPKRPDNSGNTALHEAALIGNPEVAKLLIKAGAEVNAQNKDGETPLHSAALQEKMV
jgi:uncharacterized protein